MVILVVGIWLIYPLMNQISDLNLKIGAKNEEISQAEKKINDLNTLKTEFSRFQNEVKQLAIAAPSEEQMPEILAQLEALAKKSGLEVNSIQPTTGTASNEVAINLSTKGSFTSTLLFLQNLEKNARPIQVRSINLGSAKLGETNILSTTFNLEILKAQ